MAEINLLDVYPKVDRTALMEERAKRLTEEDRKIAKQFGNEFFDGDRIRGYGGYKYDGRWVPIVKKFQEHYKLSGESSVLDVGCAKGFMLHDFMKEIPKLKVEGIDISEYAIQNAMEDIKPYVKVANAKDLSMFPDNSFDLVISINTVHNLSFDDCCKAIQEIQRVTKKDAFLTVDAYRNEEERARLKRWNLTAETYMHVDLWKKVFDYIGYKGDYYWFFPE